MKKTALILVDIQNDYFPGGLFELDGAKAAAEQAYKALHAFRKKGLPVIHIQHESVQEGATFFLPESDGMKIYESVAPQEGETVVMKHFPNSFRETDLLIILHDLGVERVVVSGMMTLMCVDATVRAAGDHGFEVIVLGDACAARELEFNDVAVPALHVHTAFLAALNMGYAKVVSTHAFLENF